MSVLVLVEHDGSSIKDATLATVSAAAKLGEVHALVVGKNADTVAQAAAKIAGVTKVHAGSSPALEHELAEPPKRQAGMKVGSVDELVERLHGLGIAK